MKHITVEYLRTNFILDFLACVPGLLTGEDILWLYPFKILRIIRLSRIITFLDKLSGLLKDRYMQHQILIDNMYKVFETIFILIFCLHALVCCFIAIGHMEPTDNTNESWIFRMALYKDGRSSTDFKFNTAEDQTTESNFNIYWTAWYYVTTSITTVGYGDISGATAPEMLFIIFLLFTGILIFTIIQ